MTLDWQTIITYVTQHKEAIILYGNTGLAVSLILQWMKHHVFKIGSKRWVHFMNIVKMEASKAILVLFTLLSLIGTAVDFLINPANAGYIPERFAYVVTAALFLHRFMVSPLGQKLGALLSPYMKAVEHMKQQKKGESMTFPDQTEFNQKAPASMTGAPELIEPFTLPGPQPQG